LLLIYSDSIPLFGYRRRSYLILSGLLGALSWSLMATVVDDKYSAVLSIVLGSLAVAVSDVVSQKSVLIIACVFLLNDGQWYLCKFKILNI
jgi:uncharacterized membrane protein YjjB (DUF3815 family)